MSVRPAALAGSFYERDPRALIQEVSRHLEAGAARLASAPLAERIAELDAPGPQGGPRALLAPHAGHFYSGRLAGLALACWLGRDVRRVIMLGPLHRVHLRQIAIPSVSHVETPLGKVAIDPELASIARGHPAVCEHDGAHAREHCLEVLLPFVQRVSPEARVLWLGVGEVEPEAVSDLLRSLGDERSTRVLVSSDLSHFLSDAGARERDAGTAQRILAHTGVSGEQACGTFPLNGFLRLSAERGERPLLLGLENSSAASGDTARVVGYGAFAFFPPKGGS